MLTAIFSVNGFMTGSFVIGAPSADAREFLSFSVAGRGHIILFILFTSFFQVILGFTALKISENIFSLNEFAFYSYLSYLLGRLPVVD